MSNADSHYLQRSEKPLRINYVAHLDPYMYAGGGEQVMRKLLDKGKQRGHDIKIASRDGRDLHDGPDLWFLCDVYNCPMNRQRPIEPVVDSVVKGSIPYVHHDNSYVDLCWHNALPCNGIGTNGYNCTVDKGICSIARAVPLYKNAIACSFMSPLHRDTCISMLSESVLPKEKTMLYLPFVNADRFQNQHLKRDIALLSYGGQSEAKGYYNIMNNLPRGSVIFIGGDSAELVKEGDGHWLGAIPGEMMPKLLNRTQNYVHLPRMPEPFSLVVAEAALCGCNLILNKMVGAASWNLDLRDPQSYTGTLDKYWEELEKRL